MPSPRVDVPVRSARLVRLRLATPGKAPVSRGLTCICSRTNVPTYANGRSTNVYGGSTRAQLIETSALQHSFRLIPTVQ